VPNSAKAEPDGVRFSTSVMAERNPVFRNQDSHLSMSGAFRNRRGKLDQQRATRSLWP